jgi:hypothetical protein
MMRNEVIVVYFSVLCMILSKGSKEIHYKLQNTSHRGKRNQQNIADYKRNENTTFGIRL